MLIQLIDFTYIMGIEEIYSSSRLIIVSIAISFLAILIFNLYILYYRRKPRFINNLIYDLDKFLIKRKINAAYDRSDMREAKKVLIKNSLNKLSSQNLEKKWLALAEVTYYAKNASKKDKEYIVEYLIDVYKTEEDIELKQSIIRAICRILKQV